MGKIVKYCSSCDEGFAEKFGFCPDCGQALQAFEMNPLMPEAAPAEEILAAPAVVEASESLEVPDEVVQVAAPAAETEVFEEPIVEAAPEAEGFPVEEPVIEPAAPKAAAASASIFT